MTSRGLSAVTQQLVTHGVVCLRQNTALSFDNNGRMDAGMFSRQQRALAELATIDPAPAKTNDDATVLDAATPFVSRGGRWRPSASLARSINAAAPGQIDCRRL